MITTTYEFDYIRSTSFTYEFDYTSSSDYIKKCTQTCNKTKKEEPVIKKELLKFNPDDLDI